MNVLPWLLIAFSTIPAAKFINNELKLSVEVFSYWQHLSLWHCRAADDKTLHIIVWHLLDYSLYLLTF